MSPAKILEFTLRNLSLLLVVLSCTGQVNAQNSPGRTLLEFKYGYHLPLGDMKDRFGSNNTIGISISKANLKTTLLAGVEGSFLFGSSVKEDVLANIRAYDGTIIGKDGAAADVNLKERAFYTGLFVGKVFKLTKTENNLTGIRVQAGGGFLQHKIRVQDNSRSVVAIQKDKLPGFDRLTNGPGVHLAAGFQYQNPQYNFQFSIMGDLYGARTASRRDFDNVTGGYLDAKRTDILAGVTISYVVSLSRSKSAENIYY